MKTVIADVMPEETRLAVLEDGKLRDYAVERDDESHIVNHIYAGTIQNILPVSYTHLTLPTILRSCRSRWSPYH